MKCYYIAICFMLACIGLCEAQEQLVASTYAWEKTRVDYEIGAGIGLARDCDGEVFWRPEPSGGIGVNYAYQPSRRYRIRAGISEQIYASNRMVEHPYPYVMDMKLKLSTYSTRLTAGTEWIFPKNEYHQTSFVGFGLYGDVIHHAKAQNWLNYIPVTTKETMNLNDSFKAITPGVMFNLGFEGSAGRLDLRYMEDIHRFDIPGIPIGKQRRSYLGLNFAFQWDVSGNNQ